MLVATYNLVGGVSLGAIGEDGAMLDQSLVCKETTCDENIRVRITNMNSEDWAIFCDEFLKNGFGVSEVSS